MNLTPMAPLTNLRLLAGVPLDITQTDTLDFSSASAQAAYFQGKTKYNLSNYGVVRFQNVIRVNINQDKIAECNYAMWQNANFGNKWFYGFISGIEYINVNMSHVTVTIDPWQTWMFDFTVQDCFVEREHPNTDIIGENLVPENLELGQYVLSDHTKIGAADPNSNIIVIASTVNPADGSDVTGGYYAGIYSGVEFFKYTSADDANSAIAALTALNKADAIVSVFMMNNLFWTEKGAAPAVKEISFPLPNKATSIDGYVPKNAKLYTYPYYSLYCTNTLGNSANYMYEYFHGGAATFGIIGNTSPNPEVTIIPRNYKIENLGNLNEKMTLNSYPQCTYNIDTFKAWLAQNGSSTAVDALGSAAVGIAGGAATLASGGSLAPISMPAMVSGIAGTLSSLTRVAETASRPPQARGAQGAGATFAFGEMDFHFYRCCITSEFAQIIDEFFSKYGYATKRVKKPNLTGRPSWNYVKTVGATVIGTVPFDDIREIKNMLDKGVTIWHGDWVGDYSRANGTPV